MLIAHVEDLKEDQIEGSGDNRVTTGNSLHNMVLTERMMPPLSRNCRPCHIWMSRHMAAADGRG